jgi:hypothetical protein
MPLGYRDLDLNVNMNATLDIVRNDATGERRSWLSDNEELIDDPLCRDFPLGIVTRRQEEVAVDVQGVVHVQVHVEINAKVIGT